MRSLSLPISLSVMLSIGMTSRAAVAPVLEGLVTWRRRIAVKAYGRPADGGRGTYVSFPVPDRPDLATLIVRAASRAGALWTAHRGLS